MIPLIKNRDPVFVWNRFCWWKLYHGILIIVGYSLWFFSKIDLFSLEKFHIGDQSFMYSLKTTFDSTFGIMISHKIFLNSSLSHWEKEQLLAVVLMNGISSSMVLFNLFSNSTFHPLRHLYVKDSVLKTFRVWEYAVGFYRWL